ncbi:hypothetical protein NCAS_0A11600 [Naumovozyma castellii]|uniref:Methylthioribose-1-phosphate isomerase n=1 Tax=Naumovozyma castellii TaxID=27288 RepID=G0V8C0_NAUCA|nr:hypothetical protein NCAS_0A11600 [Naumovozyma castellii CBS 4309]CCC67718.1 hypothetical protein NCAS_0A11600 [Naumovozyma castellii CBS 4309]
MSLEAIKFDKSKPEQVTVEIIDQLLLPYKTKYIPIHTINDGYQVIKNMQVRGAPAIAIVGSLSILVESQLLQTEAFTRNQWYYDLSDYTSVKSRLQERLKFLLSSRPTAVNLSNALVVITTLLEESTDLKGFSLAVFKFVTALIEEDLANNIKMGANGSKYLLESLKQEGFEDDFAVFTICNTGSLATSGYGTALGVIRSLWEDSRNKLNLDNPSKKSKMSFQHKAKLAHVYPLETRPYNQGSRLTAYELVHEEIPATLITDSSVAYRIKTSPIPIKAAFVGADRIVRNGDTANKIGTFQLAVICKQFGIKFFVVAPKTTIDAVTETGDDIVVEERDGDEFKLVTGTAINLETGSAQLDAAGEPLAAKVGIAPPNIDVWNPAFDITPHEFIDGIITEAGVFVKNNNGEFTLDKLF